MSTLAIDFGTTNTVFATVRDGVVSVLPFHYREPLLNIRTALAFHRTGRGEPLHDIGPWAIEQFLGDPEQTRFLQSFKSFAASASFSETQIFARRFSFSDLLQTFLAKALERVAERTVPRRVIIGRPVAFAGDRPDDQLAMRRYADALTFMGADDVHYVYEPVAAAYFYAQRLTRAATVLVGDFGGGTSDFSILRFSGRGQVKTLGQTGVGVAGDMLDYRILENVVTPALGKDGTYKSWDKVLPLPAHYFASFSRWNELCLMNRPAVLNELRDFTRSSPQAAQLESLISVIEGGESYNLYQAINTAKAELSQQLSTAFSFSCQGFSISHTITRANFERWIAQDISRMTDAATRLLSKTNLQPSDIDHIFMTGGTSFVPAVRQAFENMFGASKIDTGDELVSIAKGLALIGAADDLPPWTVAT